MQAAVQPSSLVVSLKGTPASVGEARMAALKLYRRFIYGAPLSAVELVVSELVTNAVKHGAAEPTDWLTLTCHLPDGDGQIRIEVEDPSSELPIPREVDVDAILARLTVDDLDGMTDDQLEVGGQGLHLLDELCLSWGSYTVPGGKIVHCVLSTAVAA